MAKWLAIWILTSPVVILGVPPQGLLLVAASSLLAGRLTWKQLHTGGKNSWVYLGSAASVLLILLAITPLLSMLLGAIRYVLENGPINQIAYGVPWSLSWTSGSESGFFFEAVRMSWVVIPLVCLYIIHKNWRDFNDVQSVLYPAVVVLIFTLLLISYSMGRVDPGSVSRPGLASIFSWAVLLPLLVWGVIKTNVRALAVLFVAFMSSILGFGSVSFSNLISAASAKVDTTSLRDTAKVGLANIGKAYVEDSHWERITRLNAFLKSKLGPDETYLDLTSRNAHYFYVNRQPSLVVTAPYNLVSPTQQKRVVQSIDNPPKIALLQADNIIFDGGGLALRNPYLYRFVIDNYVPRYEKGFIVGYRKASNIDALDTEISAEIKNITDANWIRGISRHEAAVVLSDPLLISMLRPGDQVRLGNGELRKINKVWVEGSSAWLDGRPLSPSEVEHPNTIGIISNPQVVREYTASLFHRSFSVSDYQKIPVAWGRSESSLKNRMTLIRSFDGVFPGFHHLSPEDGSYKVDGIDPQLIFDISNFNLSGQDSGLLRFDFKCVGKSAEPRLQVFWWGDEREGPFEESSVRFSAEDGTLIVPLDASPWWLGLDKIKGIRIDLDNVNACRAFSVERIGLYQRVF